MAMRPLRIAITLGAVALGASLAPACSNNPARGLCRDVCSCEECSNSEEEECLATADDAQEQAEAAGCTEELDTYVDCRKDAFKCDDGRAQFTEDCGPEANDLIDCGAAPPATNPCDAAAQLCGGGSQGGVQCSGQARCAAQCIVTLNSCDITNEPGLTECLNDC